MLLTAVVGCTHAPCDNNPCEDHVDVLIHTASSIDALASSHLEFCINSLCAFGAFNGVTQPNDPIANTELTGAFMASAGIQTDQSGFIVGLVTETSSASPPLADGDTYKVEIVDSAGGIIASGSQRVSYDDLSMCPGVSCKRLILIL